MQRIILNIATVILIVAFFVLIKHYYNEAKRHENNYNVVLKDKYNAEILYKNEISKNYKDIDSLRNALNIRNKTVEVIFKTKYNYKDSILLYPLFDTIKIADTIKILKTYSNKTACYDLLLIQEADTIKEFLTFKDELTGFLHWERPHKFWFIRWGAKEYFLKLYSECKKDTIRVNKLILAR